EPDRRPAAGSVHSARAGAAGRVEHTDAPAEHRRLQRFPPGRGRAGQDRL
ncbi:MAG: hypothetical protein AVDCRST_MAG68-763, partial [uncultured Gemmatimonadetes bacterium]